MAGVVLLTVRQPLPRVARQQDPGAGAVHAGLPGAFRRYLAVLVLLRVLAQVPDVAVVVLRVPVVRVLDDVALLRDHVVDDAGLDAEDPLGPGRHRHLDALVTLAVDPAAARRHRPPGIVDLAREVRRV